jgi:predicted adenylyl cyclase CyaB
LAKETEISVLIKNPEEMKAKILAMGFKHAGKSKQIDKIYDTPDAALFKSVRKIRIRLEGDAATLTYKGKPLADTAATIRDEIDVKLSPSQVEGIEEVLSCLGYGYCFQFIKERETFRLGDANITIDTYPIIDPILEIEGELAAITEIAEKLGIDTSKKYGRLAGAFREKEKETGKSTTELKEEYRQCTGIDIGRIELILA